MRGLARLCGHLGDFALALRINLRQLECFNQVAAAGSIRKASEGIGVAQPAITRTIKDLEAALGVQLFLRSGVGVTPTKYGHVLLRHSLAALEELQAAIADLDALKIAGEGQITLAGPTIDNSRIVPGAIARLKKRLPLVKVSLQVMSQERVLCAVQDGSLDVYFGRRSGAQAMSGLLFEPLFQDRLVIVAGARNPLAHMVIHDIADLMECPWIIPSVDSSFKSYVDDFFRDHKIPAPRNSVEMSFGSSMWRYLEEMNAVAAMPSNLVADEVEAGRLVVLKTDNEWLLPDIGIAIRAEARSNKLIGVLIQEFRRVAAQRKAELQRLASMLGL
jgi:DNA-binding transcriptional LysR family regulator